MLNLRPEHQKRYEQLGKDRSEQAPAGPVAANDPPASSSNHHVNGPANPPRPPTDGISAAGDAAVARFRGTDLMKLLGFSAVTDHGVEIRLWYLVGCAYRCGAHSGRQIAQILAAPPPELLANDLAVRVRQGLLSPRKMRSASISKEPSVGISKRKLFDAIAALEDLLGVSLVVRLGDNLPFPELTKAGEAFWKVVAAYLRDHL